MYQGEDEDAAQHVEVSVYGKECVEFEGTRADVNEIEEIVIGNNMIGPDGHG